MARAKKTSASAPRRTRRRSQAPEGVPLRVVEKDGAVHDSPGVTPEIRAVFDQITASQGSGSMLIDLVRAQENGIDLEDLDDDFAPYC